MSNAPHRGGNGVADTPEEELVLIHVAIAAVAIVLGSAGALWLFASAWLVEHKVLVSAAAKPLIEIPGTAGAGLDLPRIAIAGGILLAGLAAAVSAVRRAWTRRREELV